MKFIRFFKNVFKLLKTTFSEFGDDNALKFSAALAYYTVFALAPALLLITSLLGIFFGKEAIQGEIYGQIDQLVGHQPALQIQEIIKNIHLSHDNLLASALGVIVLVIATSGIFGEIQDSINNIWGIKVKPKKGFIKLVINRLLSFSMIATVGFILTVALVINALVAILSHALSNYFPGITIYFVFFFDNLLTFIAISSLFGIIFKVLPDARIKWKYVSVGALVTASLFMIGKFVIGYYLSVNNFTSLYGAAASIMLIMVWVYYNAIILYFGAEFTQVYTQFIGGEILPTDYSVFIEKKTIEVKGPINKN